MALPTACTARPAVVYLVDASALPSYQQEQVATSIQDWQDACVASGLQFRMVASCGSTPHCMTILPGTLESLGTGHVGFTTYDDANDSSAISLRSDAIPLVVIHEMGHAMGLHHDHPGTVMCAYTFCDADKPTPDDAAQFASLH